MPIPPTSPRSIGHTIRRALHVPDTAPLLLPLALIGAFLALLAGAYAYAAGWLTPRRLTPALIVSALNTAGGTHPGLRRNHAKGECVAGYFDGNGNAADLSTAAVFGAIRTPVVGRFAIPGANPSIPDASSPVRSMALLFQMANGEQWRTGMNSTGVFVVNTPQGFYDQQLASVPDPSTGKPNPARLQAFFAAHPETGPFRAWVKQHPPSSTLANGTYSSLNAFQLIAADGGHQAVRWAMVPHQPYLPMDAHAALAPNFLSADLAQQLRKGVLQWDLILTLAGDGDVTNDATKAWPAGRTKVNAGTLTLSSTVAQSDGTCRDINFDPTVLPRGIQTSDDPLLAARSGAYSNSFNRRLREEAAAGASTPKLAATSPGAAQ